MINKLSDFPWCRSEITGILSVILKDAPYAGCDQQFLVSAKTVAYLV